MSTLDKAYNRWYEAEQAAGSKPGNMGSAVVFRAGWHAALTETGLLEAAEEVLEYLIAEENAEWPAANNNECDQLIGPLKTAISKAKVP